jgi:hypothetical protein
MPSIDPNSIRSHVKRIINGANNDPVTGLPLCYVDVERIDYFVVIDNGQRTGVVLQWGDDGNTTGASSNQSRKMVNLRTNSNLDNGGDADQVVFVDIPVIASWTYAPEGGPQRITEVFQNGPHNDNRVDNLVIMNPWVMRPDVEAALNAGKNVDGRVYGPFTPENFDTGPREIFSNGVPSWLWPVFYVTHDDNQMLGHLIPQTYLQSIRPLGTGD